MESDTIRIGLVGAGGMGSHQVGAFEKVNGCEIVAICDVNRDQAARLAKKAGAQVEAFDDVDAFLANADFDAVTNCTPDRFHHPITLKAIEAGKHVLCEKPLATNYQEAAEMRDAAAAAGLINMVNFSYRDAPAIQTARELVQSGTIGRVIHLEASYYQSWLTSNAWGDWRTSPAWLWRLSTEHGSQGTLGDIGVHILDFASYPVGDYNSVRCELRTFDKAPGGEIDGYVLDANDTVAITAEFASGALGVISASRWATGYGNRLLLTVFGDEGAVRVNLDKDRHSVDLCSGSDVHERAWTTVAAEPTPNNYERFVASIRSGENDQPDFARGAQIQKVLDACFESDETGSWIQL